MNSSDHRSNEKYEDVIELISCNKFDTTDMIWADRAPKLQPTSEKMKHPKKSYLTALLSFDVSINGDNEETDRYVQ